MSRLLRTIVFISLFSVCGCSSSTFPLKQRTYSNTVVLGKNVGDNVVLNAGSFAKPNTKYIVRGNCSLNDAKIRVGSDCIIILDGGKLRNGEIVGNDTYITISKGDRFFSDITFSGSFIMPIIKSDYFAIDETTLCDMFDLTSKTIKNDVYINDNLSVTIPSEWNGVVTTKSNTNIYVNAAITLNANSFKGGNVFYIRDCHDVTISGNGKIVGDLLTHEGNEGECIYGVFIRNSENISIKNITCEYFWGDGIYIYPGSIDEKAVPICRNIVIDGVTCNSNRRQGISIVGGENIVIKNSRLINTGIIRGTAPSSGIDIEPAGGAIADNITIECCVFNNNGNTADCPSDLQVVNNYGAVSIKRCRLQNFFYGHADNINFEDCEIEGQFYTSSSGIGNNVRIVNSSINKIHNNLIKNGNVKLVNTTIGTNNKH